MTTGLILESSLFYTLRTWRYHKQNPQNYSKAKFRRRTSHEPNRMQMRKIPCSTLLAFDLAHVKYGVWTWPKFFKFLHRRPFVRHLTELFSSSDSLKNGITPSSLNAHTFINLKWNAIRFYFPLFLIKFLAKIDLQFLGRLLKTKNITLVLNQYI